MTANLYVEKCRRRMYIQNMPSLKLARIQEVGLHYLCDLVTVRLAYVIDSCVRYQKRSVTEAVG